MREHLDKEINSLNQGILKMSILVEENLQLGLRSLLDRDKDMADKVIKNDSEVNKMEFELGDLAALIIARQHPVASDLRHVIGALKIITDIERIGDVAVHLGRRAKEFAVEEFIKPLIDIPKMVLLGIEMLRQCVEAYLNADEKMARSVAHRDEEIDNLKKQVYRELLTYMMEDSRNIKQATKLLFLSRLIERMGDHAVAICEWAIYSATGVREDL